MLTVEQVREAKVGPVLKAAEAWEAQAVQLAKLVERYRTEVAGSSRTG